MGDRLPAGLASERRFATVPFSDQTVDGARLLAQAVGFGRELRRVGLGADLASAVDFARALTAVDVGDRGQVRAAGAAIFVRRRDDLEPYGRAFDRWWRRRRPRDMEGPTLRSAVPEAEAAEAEDGDEGEDAQDRPTREQRQALPAAPSDEDAEPEGEELEGLTIAPEAYSRGEVLQHKSFDRMTGAELRDAERLIDLLAPRLETRRTRRYELHQHGRYLAPRAMFRRNLATGGQLLDWEWRRPVRHPRPIVVLCDISGSMERHSRLLLRFIMALTAANVVKTESFVFGTRLTRVTRLLRDRQRDRALERVSDEVTDWAGGTRIGESFRDFNQRWARRTLRTSGVVIVISDGWDRGDPAIVAAETARLRRNCHRLIWLNPLASAAGYRPLAAGMAAAYPFVDDFLAAGTVASLERLGELLAGARMGAADRARHRRAGAVTGGGDLAIVAAAHAHGVSAGTAPPRPLEPDDPSAARPLR
ncbi:MAG TPA: VWA domain-containing protein [Candidatus Limnocylindrales bacterium]|nr:VWA domain-containing protein [Candidatus Limnocylindrales bacterium]